ncbi:MAG: TIGR01212 family radical SAM protein [Erysipelotrichaceae bacterium]
MKQINPFPFSKDNKRYHTFNYAMREKYHTKIVKIPIDAGFTCPNRDGTCGVGGCTFCGFEGSGTFIQGNRQSLLSQYEEGKKFISSKWKDYKTFVYFQSFTNTYAPLETIQSKIEPFLKMDEVKGIVLATRADCLQADKIAYLASLCQTKDIWIELGLQSKHDETAKLINRGHTFSCFCDCMEALAKTKIKVSVHIINSLPNENEAMMMATVDALAKLKIDAIKIHMLHIMKDTLMAKEYLNSPFPLLSKDAYIKLVVDQLEILPPSVIVERLTGDGKQADLIAPLWTGNKKAVLNDIDKEFVRRDSWQGKYYQEKR